MRILPTAARDGLRRASHARKEGRTRLGDATSWAMRETFRYQQGTATEMGDPLGLPLHVVEDDKVGFLAWAFDPVKLYLDVRKEATFVEIMQEKARRLGLALAV